MKKTFRLHYRYSKFWLIFWIIFFFPVALVLLLTGSSFKYDQCSYSIYYTGSRFWLCFWTIFFFPIAFTLIFLNGMSVEVQTTNNNCC